MENSFDKLVFLFGLEEGGEGGRGGEEEEVTEIGPKFGHCPG